MFDAYQQVVDLMLDQLEKVNGINQEKAEKWIQ